MVIAILGLGEAGAAIGADLAAAGAEVCGWDVRAEGAAVGVRRADGPAQAVAGSDLVMSLTTAPEAVDAARSVASSLRAGQVYADVNSAGVQLKQQLAEIVERSGALFADVALMAPVPGRGVRTPAFVSGPGAQQFADALRPCGMPVRIVGLQPGDAARLKLLRSVFVKGMAAVMTEAVAAARAAGCEDWMHEEILGVLAGSDAAFVTRLQQSSVTHATRRIHEVQDAALMLRELGVEPRVCEAAVGWLQELRNG